MSERNQNRIGDSQMKHQKTASRAKPVTRTASPPPRKTRLDRCACGGLWVGGQCSRCGAKCKCARCRRGDDEIAKQEAAEKVRAAQDANRRTVSMAAVTYRVFHKMWLKGSQRFPKSRVEAAREALFAAIDAAHLPGELLPIDSDEGDP